MREKSLERLLTRIQQRDEELLAKLTQAVSERSATSTAPTPSARAYEGLTEAVQEANQHRRAHLAQLAHLDRALRAATSLDVPRKLLADFMMQAGLERVTDTDRAELFTVDEARVHTEAVEAAYVDTSTGRVVRQGRMPAKAAAA